MLTIRCWWLRSALTSYIDDTVSAGSQGRVEDHLKACERCRRRVTRDRAVRQRLRRWAEEMRRDGALVPPVGAEAVSRGRAFTGLRGGMAAAAGISLVAALWYLWTGGAEVVLAARGQITDDRCVHGHQHSDSALRDATEPDCVRRCVRRGAKYVFVSDGVVYHIANQDFQGLVQFAGQAVQLEGEVRRKVVTVERVHQPAPSLSARTVS
ncbi:MAG: hypothetical protein GEU82_14360 [Luteitalea sp.]|nr:hypothetical protein [Luteitalea sp.]